jgi:hypothetical protein
VLGRGSEAKYRYVDATRALGPNASIYDLSQFRENVLRPHAEVYALIEPMNDASIAEFLQEVRANPDSLRRVRNEFPALFATAWEHFHSVLPLRGDAVEVYVIHHELTHLHHQQVNAEIKRAARDFFAGVAGSSSRLYHLMWLEGLAAHVSQVLNPDAGSFEVFLTRDMAHRMEQRWDACIARIDQHFDSDDADVISRYVFQGDGVESIPGRAGYYIGSRIAGHLSNTRTLSELANLSGWELRDTLRESLHHIQPARA